MVHQVVVFAKGDSQFVVPPSLPVHVDDEIIFHATREDVTLLFPPNSPLNPHAPDWRIIDGAAGRPVSLTVHDTPLGRYPYAVWCPSEDPRFRTFAKGSSDPEIILY